MKNHLLDSATLQEEVNKSLWEFDKANYETKMNTQEMMSKPDEDGWITVGRHSGKKSGDAIKVGVATVSPTTLLHTSVQKAKEKKLNDFYRFQRSQNKQDYIATLRMKFEQDKKRIESMKQKRKFKPF